MIGRTLTDVPKPLLIFGAGGLAADIIDMIERIGSSTIAGLVVDGDRPSDDDARLRVFHWDEARERAADFHAVNAMGRPSRRPFIEKAEAAGFEFLTLIDPSAQIFPSAVIGEGCIVGAGTIVAAATDLGRHVFLNRGVLIGHHMRIEPFATVQAGARVGGHGILAEQCEIGIGATVIDRIHIGARTIVGAGAVVVRDCPPDVTMVGIPARKLER